MLLESDNIKLYEEFNYFLSNPYEILEPINDKLQLTDVKTDKQYINFIKDYIYKLYLNQSEDYYNFIINGQCDIWDQVGKTYVKLKEIEKELIQLQVDYIENNYVYACKEVQRVIDLFSNSLSEVTKFERAMGLDRYLSYININDLDMLNMQVQEIKYIANKKLDKYKDLFQLKWNLTSISEVIIHMMLKENTNNPVTRNVWKNQNKVILVLIDGFGYSQYLWNKRYLSLNKSYTFNENILGWLDGDKNFKNHLMLGSSLVSDTGAGLSQIFAGKLPRETGVMSSKIYRDDYDQFYYYNSRHKSPIIDIKNTHFNFTEMINLSGTESFLQTLNNYGVCTNVFFCAKYRGNKYSKYCFGDSQVYEIIPPERVFSILLEKLDSFRNNSDNKECYIIYYTAIDSTGHPIGAFTSFELYEHQKINMLLTNFLIHLVIYNPEIFDGRTTIVITADHGMAETSKKVISQEAFSSLYPELILKQDSIVENNRSMLFYNIVQDKLLYAADKIKDIFAQNGISVQVFTKDDEIVKQLLHDSNNKFSSKNCPDILALIDGDGIVFSKNIDRNLYHFGGHGGRSLEEVFVPLLLINLSKDLKEKIEKRFLKLM